MSVVKAMKAMVNERKEHFASNQANYQENMLYAAISNNAVRSKPQAYLTKSQDDMGFVKKNLPK